MEYLTQVYQIISQCSVSIHLLCCWKKKLIILKSRTLTTLAIQKFKASLQSTDFINVIPSSDCQQTNTLFQIMLSKIQDTCFPLKTIKHTRKLWLKIHANSG